MKVRQRWLILLLGLALVVALCAPFAGVAAADTSYGLGTQAPVFEPNSTGASAQKIAQVVVTIDPYTFPSGLDGASTALVEVAASNGSLLDVVAWSVDLTNSAAVNGVVYNTQVFFAYAGTGKKTLRLTFYGIQDQQSQAAFTLTVDARNAVPGDLTLSISQATGNLINNDFSGASAYNDNTTTTTTTTTTTPASSQPTTGSTGNAQAAPTTRSFSDVSVSYWAYKAIADLNSLGCISGYQDGAFRPDGAITRVEFISILSRALQLPAYQPEAPDFADIAPADWYYSSVESAVYAGIVKGAGGSFDPGAPVTREQLAPILVNALGKQATTALSDQTTFTDNASISGWARSFVALAVQDGLLKGYPDNSFRPQGGATRAEACSIIDSLLSNRK